MTNTEMYASIEDELDNVYDIFLSLDIDEEHIDNFLVLKDLVEKTIDKAKSYDQIKEVLK